MGRHGKCDCAKCAKRANNKEKEPLVKGDDKPGYCNDCEEKTDCLPPYYPTKDQEKGPFDKANCPQLPEYRLPQAIGYPNCEPCPYYNEPAASDTGAAGLKGLAAKNRKHVLKAFHDYIRYYEHEWTPVKTNKDTCKPYGDCNQNFPNFTPEGACGSADCRYARKGCTEQEKVEYTQKKWPRAYIAINAVQLQNPIPGDTDNKQFFQMMRIISSHMCMATAGHPGFLGYDIIRQTGSCPAMQRWAVDADSLRDGEPFWMDQYTIWRSYEDHEDFHELFEDVVMEACMHCGMVMVGGAYETVYTVLDRYLPRVVTNSTYNKILTNPARYSKEPNVRKAAERNVRGYAVDTGEITNLQMFYDVIPGHEDIFEVYINQVFQNLMSTGHCLGYFVSRSLGYNTSGQAAYKIKSMYWEFMDRSGPRQLEENASLQETFPLQPRYLIRADWSSVAAIKMYLSQVHTDRRNLFPFSLGVLDRCSTRPEVRVSVPHKSDYRWLEYLNNTMVPRYEYLCDYVANLAFAPDLCQDKWFYFFGFERDECDGHRKTEGGHLIPIAADKVVPALPGFTGPGYCTPITQSSPCQDYCNDV